MKILLIEPPKPALAIGGDDVFIFELLALEYVAAGVLPEHDVRILDLRLDNDLHGTLAEFNPDLVGITAYTVHVNVVKNLFAQIKAWNARVLTVVGGHHATVMPADFISPFIDIIVVGEGVLAFKEIVARFTRGADIEGIQGTFLPQQSDVAKMEPQPTIDLAWAFGSGREMLRPRAVARNFDDLRPTIRHGMYLTTRVYTGIDTSTRWE